VSEHESKCGDDGTAEVQFQRLIQLARTGDRQSLEQLFDSCRDYLLLIANQQLEKKLQAKIGPSDVVQESLITAHRKLDQFTGASRPELLAWLRGILINDMRMARRQYSAIKRSVNQEARFDFESGAAPPIIDDHFTPATQASVNEQSVLLNLAIAQLDEDYQTVIRKRNWQQMSFNEIANDLGRSPDAVRKLWARAIVALEKAVSSLQGFSE
jgi:RNA polymerase sigma-70 factor, ECF subfamily